MHGWRNAVFQGKLKNKKISNFECFEEKTSHSFRAKWLLFQANHSPLCELIEDTKINCFSNHSTLPLWCFSAEYCQRGRSLSSAARGSDGQTRLRALVGRSQSQTCALAQRKIVRVKRSISVGAEMERCSS